MDLTSSLETERHMAKELAGKLSDMGVELEESKQLVSSLRLCQLHQRKLLKNIMVQFCLKSVC